MCISIYLDQVIAVNELGESAASVESYYLITLREPPSGKPTITEAANASASALRLAWAPPHPSTLHGEFLGYRLSVRLRREGAVPLIIQLKGHTPIINQSINQSINYYCADMSANRGVVDPLSIHIVYKNTFLTSLQK